MKFKKRPVVVDAVQWTGENHREMYDFLANNTKIDKYMEPYVETFYIDHSKVKGGLVIKTLEGEHIAKIGSYIIRGVKGEFYPCEPDIFEQTYEPVVENRRMICPLCYGSRTVIAMMNDPLDPTTTECLQCGGKGYVEG